MKALGHKSFSGMQCHNFLVESPRFDSFTILLCISYLIIGFDRFREGLVGGYLRLALQERVEAFLDPGQFLFGDLQLAPRHVCRLFGIEMIGNAFGDEHVQLETAFVFFLLPKIFTLNSGKKFPV